MREWLSENYRTTESAKTAFRRLGCTLASFCCVSFVRRSERRLAGEDLGQCAERVSLSQLSTLLDYYLLLTASLCGDATATVTRYTIAVTQLHYCSSATRSNI